MGWTIAAAIIVGMVYCASRIWTRWNTPPSGYTIEIVEQGGRFERVVARDSSGREISTGNYTSVYGLSGAARSAIRDARAHQRIVNRRPVEVERFNRTYRGVK